MVAGVGVAAISTRGLREQFFFSNNKDYNSRPHSPSQRLLRARIGLARRSASSPLPDSSSGASAPSSATFCNRRKMRTSRSTPSAAASGTSSGRSSARPKSSGSARSPASRTPSSSGDFSPSPSSASTTSPPASASASSHHTSFIGSFYFLFAAAWALLVAVSIAGLFVRRFFVRPIWLGKKVSYESGFIAFLIFLLMVTYLAAFFVAEGSHVTSKLSGGLTPSRCSSFSR